MGKEQKKTLDFASMFTLQKTVAIKALIWTETVNGSMFMTAIQNAFTRS